MKKEFSIDLKEFTIERFFELTGARRMLAGRKMLHDSADDRLMILKSERIKNLYDLLSALKSKEKITEFSQRTGIPESYLVILKREAGSYIPRPLKLSEFPGIPIEYVLSLESKGIKNSRHLFEANQTEEERKDLSKRTGIPSDRLLELYNLCDLARITGIGGIFARIVYEAGIISVEQFAESNIQKSYPEYVRIKKLRGYSKVSFSENDIEYCIGYAKELIV